MKFWINTVSRDHVIIGKEGGFIQANHGAPYNLKKLKKGDMILFYSPKTSFREGTVLKNFTAIVYVTGEAPYRAEISPDFHPFRRNVEFLECKEASILPLIEKLSFIKDKKKWGFPFRRGMFEISREDFIIIAEAMEAEVDL